MAENVVKVAGDAGPLVGPAALREQLACRDELALMRAKSRRIATSALTTDETESASSWNGR